MLTKSQAASFKVFKVNPDAFNVTESRINPSCKINVTSLSSITLNVYKWLRTLKLEKFLFINLFLHKIKKF